VKRERAEQVENLIQNVERHREDNKRRVMSMFLDTLEKEAARSDSKGGAQIRSFIASMTQKKPSGD